MVGTDRQAVHRVRRAGRSHPTNDVILQYSFTPKRFCRHADARVDFPEDSLLLLE
jgi:hypothetical protein